MDVDAVATEVASVVGLAEGRSGVRDVMRAIARSEPGAASYRDLPPGTYRFTVQPLSGIPTGYKDKVRLAPGTHAYLEIQWGPSWLEGQPGGYTFYVRTLSSQLGKAYFDSMRYVGPDRI